MSIFVEDLEMPKTCSDCEWSYYVGNGRAICRRVSKTDKTDIMLERRADFCPLIEVPTPHGRLGDLDELVKTLEQNRLCYVLDIDDESFELGINKAIDIVRNAKTIIKAKE